MRDAKLAEEKRLAQIGKKNYINTDLRYICYFKYIYLIKYIFINIYIFNIFNKVTLNVTILC